MLSRKSECVSLELNNSSENKLMRGSKYRVLVFGATGMLGSTLFRILSADASLQVFGTVRNHDAYKFFGSKLGANLISNVHADSEMGILKAFASVQPDLVINCVGIIKQLPYANDPLVSLAINATLPHRLSKYCATFGARLVHFSTDCVFSGEAGGYKELDYPDAHDLYGRTKFLGELDEEHTVTLRTSIIGHELSGKNSLVDWFLSQSGEAQGYRKALFSGLPTIEVARVIRDHVIPNPCLRGLYHLSVDPINKYDLLCLIAKIYSKDINVIPDDQLMIDRSLNSARFRGATGYEPKPWPELVKDMYIDYVTTGCAAK